MKLYKLTDQAGKTRAGHDNETQWGPGVTHQAIGKGKSLCSPDYIHAYESPLLAVLLNPIHANIQNPKLWEAKGCIAKRDGKMKCGCRILTTVVEVPLPYISCESLVRFAIGCAVQSYPRAKYKKWALAWLDGSDRSADAACAAADAADAANVARAAIDLVKIAEWAMTNENLEALKERLAK